MNSQYSLDDWDDLVEYSLTIYQNQLTLLHMVQVQGYLYILQNLFQCFKIPDLEVIDEYHCSIRYWVTKSSW